MSITQLISKLDGLIQFGDYSISTAKKVIRGLNQRSGNPPMIRPKEGLASFYAAPGGTKSDYDIAAGVVGVPNVEPHTIYVPRKSLHPESIGQSPLMYRMHEGGHAADPLIIHRGLWNKRSQEIAEKALKSGDVATAGRRGIALGRVSVGAEVAANRNVLDQIKKYGTPKEIASWKATATKQVRGYQLNIMKAVGAARPGGMPLSAAKDLVRVAPYLKRVHFSVLRSGSLSLNALLGDLIEFQEPRRNYGQVAKDAVIGGATSAVGTAGLLAGAGLILKRKAPDLAGMLRTAAGQHIKVFNPLHTAPMMRSLPEASRLFGKELRATKGIEKIATEGHMQNLEHIQKAYQESGLHPEKDIADIAGFKKKWGRTPGETMEKSVGLLSGMAATGVGVAGGAALSKGWQKRNSNESSNLSSLLSNLIEFDAESGMAYVATSKKIGRHPYKAGFIRPRMYTYNKGNLNRGEAQGLLGGNSIAIHDAAWNVIPTPKVERRGVIIHPNTGAIASEWKDYPWTLRKAYGTPEAMSKSMRRHELTHALRDPSNYRTSGNVRNPNVTRIPKAIEETKVLKRELLGKKARLALKTPAIYRLLTYIRGLQFSAARNLFSKVIEFNVTRSTWDSYREHVFKDGRRINIDKLMNRVKSRPVKNVPMKDLTGIDRSKRSGFSLKRLAAADTKVPILISPDNGVLDGRHRVIKHQSEGHRKINAIRVTDKDIKATEFSAARRLFSKVIEFQKLYVPGEKDEPPEELPSFTEGEPIDYTVQRHAAKRAGLHRDVRIGTPSHGLYSWATRKDLPGEGGKIAVHPQPVHSHGYLGWEGNIPEGQYGAGDVSTEHLGKALVTRSTPEEVHATLSDQKEHHRIALVKTGKGWLMTRGKPPEPPTEAQKPKYKSVGPERAHEVLDSLEEGSIVQPKVDGALVYVTTKGNRPEIFSHRKGKQSGRNIIHTERFFHGRPTTNIPAEHQRTLIGELYGTKRGKAIEPQELGGILNTHLGESIAKQKSRGVKLKIMPFDYADGKDEPYPERLAKVKQTLEHLPPELFHPPEEATGPGAARALFEKIRSGKHPLTKEGIIIHPPTGKMIKVKNTEEADVPITGTFPGTGKFEGSHGGFTYEGGRVGTGLSDETRAKLHEYVGRVARIRHQGRYPSGAYRAPSLVAIEENK